MTHCVLYLSRAPSSLLFSLPFSAPRLHPSSAHAHTPDCPPFYELPRLLFCRPPSIACPSHSVRVRPCSIPSSTAIHTQPPPPSTLHNHCLPPACAAAWPAPLLTAPLFSSQDTCASARFAVHTLAQRFLDNMRCRMNLYPSTYTHIHILTHITHTPFPPLLCTSPQSPSAAAPSQLAQRRSRADTSGARPLLHAGTASLPHWAHSS